MLKKVLPEARQDKLLVQAVGNELVVYDKERDRAHLLNRPAALIWRHCDGLTNISDMVALLQNESLQPADEGVVWLALARLDGVSLLRERLTPPAHETSRSRRQILTSGLAAGLLLPVVVSILVPTPAMAQCSGGGGGDGRVCDPTIQSCGPPPVCDPHIATCFTREDICRGIKFQQDEFCRTIESPGIRSQCFSDSFTAYKECLAAP